MNKTEYMKFHSDCCERMKAITKAKNADYTGTSEDPFHNFSATERSGITTTEQGFLVRMQDKFARLVSFVQKGVLEVKDESVEDTLLDLANYCLLMSGYIKSKRPSSVNIGATDNKEFKKSALDFFDKISQSHEGIADQLPPYTITWQSDTKPHDEYYPPFTVTCNTEPSKGIDKDKYRFETY